MALFIVSFVAGIMTALAPCVLPLLPVIIGSSVGARSKATPVIVIGSLALSILLFTYLLKASTALITIPPYVWSYLSGGILLGFGFVLVFPWIWDSLPFIGKASASSNKLLGAGHQKKSIWGDVLVGAALGPVFSTCSPTYFVILATVLPASFLLGTFYLITYIAGLVFVLALIAILGQKITGKLQVAADSKGLFKKGIGILFVIVGLFIITGLDKKLETKVLDSGYFDITRVEQRILDGLMEEPEKTSQLQTNPALVDNKVNENIPRNLLTLFPNTDWSKVDENIVNALPGGPSRDGIPALENPEFVAINEVDYDDSIQAIVLNGENETRVYPYNVLTWHEIVNDEIDGTPVSVTFCPLCGSAIVYDRTLPDGRVTTLGVSGSLLESNMIMFDRTTENLWQQSTGEVLAGSFYPDKLKLMEFQLLDLATIKEAYPDAKILSTNTGHNRDYYRNPYAGYEENDRFAFNPSELDTTFPLKSIMVVFRTTDGTPVTIPWLELREKVTHQEKISDQNYIFRVTDNGVLTITDDNGKSYPFYFEMWFSTSIQHDDLVIVNP